MDLRPLIEAEWACAEDMRAMRARHGKFHACQRVVGEFDKPARAVFFPEPPDDARRRTAPHGARRAGSARRHDRRGRSVRPDRPRRWTTRLGRASGAFVRRRRRRRGRRGEPRPPSTRANPRLAGAGAAGGGFFAGADADGMATRSVKACSAYATRDRERARGRLEHAEGQARATGGEPAHRRHRRRARASRDAARRFRGVALERAAREETRVAENNRFRRTRRVARSSCASTSKAGSSLSSGGRAPPPRKRGFVPRRGGEGARVRVAARERSEERLVHTVPYVRLARRTHNTQRTQRASRLDRRTERTGAVPPPAVREYSTLTLGAAPRVGGEVWTPGASASARWAGGPGGTRRRPSRCAGAGGHQGPAAAQRRARARARGRQLA